MIDPTAARTRLIFATNHDRRSFLRIAGLVGVGAGLVAGGLLEASGLAAAQDAKAPSDVDILNYALVLEYLEADFYNTAVGLDLIKGRDLELLTPIADHEKQHVVAVTDAVKTLGGTPAAKPKVNYPMPTWQSRDAILKNASTLEEVGVTAYHGQVPLISSPDVLAAAASIAGVESRHAAILATLIGGQPFPQPLEQHRTKEEVLKIVAPILG